MWPSLGINHRRDLICIRAIRAVQVTSNSSPETICNFYSARLFSSTLANCIKFPYYLVLWKGAYMVITIKVKRDYLFSVSFTLGDGYPGIGVHKPIKMYFTQYSRTNDLDLHLS